MTYTEYVHAHRQAESDLAGAEKNYDDLQKEYENSSSEARPDLEPDLKEAKNQVDEAQANLDTLETQNPEHASELKGFEEAMDHFDSDVNEQFNKPTNDKSIDEIQQETAENLYSKATGQEYTGQPENLRSSLSEAIEENYGPESKATFEQAYPAPEPEIEQTQEQSQGLSY